MPSHEILWCLGLRLRLLAVLFAGTWVGNMTLLGEVTPDGLKSAEVLVIDRQPVTVAELQLVMRLHVAEVFQHYKISAGSVDDRGFWESSINGEKPIERLRARAVEDLTDTRCRSSLAAALGIPVPNFAQLAEGTPPNPNLRAGAPQFGAIRYDATSLYLDAVRRMRSDILRAIMGVISANESGLQADYERQRARWRSGANPDVFLTYAEARTALLVEQTDAECLRRYQALLAKVQADLVLPAGLRIYPGAEIPASFSNP